MKQLELSESEIRLFLKWFRRPAYLVETLIHLYQLLLERKNSRDFIHSNIDNKSHSPKAAAGPLYLKSVRQAIKKRKEKYTHVSVPLAGIDFQISENVNWSICFADREDYNALHRFGWLHKTPYFFRSAKLGYQLIYDWIKNFHHDKDDFAYQSYNIAERLVNWVLFFSRWQRLGFPKKEI